MTAIEIALKDMIVYDRNYSGDDSCINAVVLLLDSNLDKDRKIERIVDITYAVSDLVNKFGFNIRKASSYMINILEGGTIICTREPVGHEELGFTKVINYPIYVKYKGKRD